MKKIYFMALALAGISFSNAQMWVAQPTNWTANWGVDEISIVDQNTAWIFAYDGINNPSTYPHDIAVTTDGGQNWNPISPDLPSNALISDIAGIDGNTAFIVTAPYTAGANANGIWKTTDGGFTWTQQDAFETASFGNQIYFWDADNGFAAGDPLNGKFEMYKTSDGGATWNLVTTAPEPLGGAEYSYVGVKDVVGDNIWLGTDQGRLLRSNDRGVTWDAFFSPVIDFGAATTPGSTGSFAFADANNGLLIAVDNTSDAVLYKTTDGGETWEDITPTGPWYFADVAYVPGTQQTFVTTGSNFNDESWMGSSYSTDGGMTWTAIDSGEQRTKVSFLNGTTGWAGQFSDGPGGSTGILKFDGNLMAVNDVVQTNLQVYPNPATNVINFTAQKEIASVTLRDMTGKIVVRSKDVQVNVSSLPAGVYIAQVLYKNNAVENIKVVVK
jgi:photosystem II stability/assembly factor-like uncharacterized protein